jgi:NAD(P)-dependent dehydrogenase (short-subunit alcohol dehydrogenase family)
VTIAGRSLDRLEKAKASLLADIPKDASPAPSVFTCQCDGTKEEEVEKMIQKAYKNGGNRLDVLVLSAGGGDPEGGGMRLLANTEVKSFEVGRFGRVGNEITHGKLTLLLMPPGSSVDILLIQFRPKSTIHRTHSP